MAGLLIHCYYFRKVITVILKHMDIERSLIELLLCGMLCWMILGYWNF